MSIKNILREELSNNIKIVNSSELRNGDFGDKNTTGRWSAEEIVNNKNGKYPYFKKGFIVRKAEKSFEIKDCVYLTPDEANKINALGQKIQRMNDEYNKLMINNGISFEVKTKLTQEN